jgi:predicted nucleotidyltransferase
MDMYQLKWTRLQSEIFRFLCIKAGEQLNQRTIAKSLHVSPTSIAKALIPLEKSNLIKVNKNSQMNLNLIELNRDNNNAIDMKRIENLKMIYESGLIRFLKDNLPGSSIILFGSYSRGEDTSNNHKSDIDIAIIGVKPKEIDLTTFDKLLEREISLNFYTSFKDIHKHLKDNILNGILLSGSVDL